MIGFGFLQSVRFFLWALLVGRLAAAAELKWPPENFPRYRDLAFESWLGEDIETVEPIGRIVKMKTMFDPFDINSLHTKFTIHTRSGSSKLMAFIPNGFAYSHVSIDTLCSRL